MGQIQLTLSLALMGLFSIAVIGFAMNFAVDNNSAVSVVDDPEVSLLYSQTKTNVSSFGGSSEDQYQSIIDSTIEPGSQTTQTSGAFSITPLNAMAVAKNIMKTGYIKIFGTGSGFGIFISTLIGFLVFMMGLYVYKTWKGFPD